MVETTSPQPHPYAFLHGNYRDASAWAAEYMRLHGDKLPDEGNLLGWFANAIETQHLNSVEQPYDPAADRPGESLRGDRFRDRMIELLELAHGGFDKDQKETVRIAADQIQNATDLVFHGALTALDDLGDARKRNPCAEFTVRLMLSEIMDHGFVVGELGLLECQNTVVEKVGGTVTTTWLPNGSHCDFERHDPRPNGNSISIGEE